MNYTEIVASFSIIMPFCEKTNKQILYVFNMSTNKVECTCSSIKNKQTKKLHQTQTSPLLHPISQAPSQIQELFHGTNLHDNNYFAYYY